MASKAVKIVLIGCGAVVIIGIVAVGIGGYFLKQWGSSKLKTIENIAGGSESEYGKKTADLSRQYAFQPPDNNLVTEPQLIRFLAVRKQMHEVYQKYEAEFKKLDSNEGFQGAMKGLSMWNEVKLSHARALESQKMSPEEYTYIVTSVYKTWFAKGASEALQNQSFSDATANQLKSQIGAMDQQMKDPNLPADAKDGLQKARDELQAQLDGLPKNEEVNQIDEQIKSVPQENIALFKKYQKDIETYSMSGLEAIGL